MNLLLKSVKVTDATSSFNGSTLDIYIEDGLIKKISSSITLSDCKKDTQEYNGKGKNVSTGWFDMRVNFCEPGHEQKETVASGQEAAAAGGFTGTLVMPSTQPVIQSRADVEYIYGKSKGRLTDVFVAGTLTANADGKDLADLHDMKSGGAVIFTDYKKFIADAGIMLRALQYADTVDTRIISYCDDRGLSGNNIANESTNTMLLGFKGSPGIAEETALLRDLTLCKYSNSPVHFSGISTKGAIDLIRNAKTEGLKVTCEVNAYHLLLTDAMLDDFDTNYKVNPPLRSDVDRKALVEAVIDGTIDVIVSDHSPQDIESKNVEWHFAEFGMIGLESMFGVLCKATEGKLPIDKLVEKITVNPRRILQLPLPEIKEGVKANLTVFDVNEKWQFTARHITSKSSNSPFMDTELLGKPHAAINNNLIRLIN